MNIKKAGDLIGKGLQQLNPFSYKSNTNTEEYFQALIDMSFIGNYGWSEIRASMAWQYYKKVSPIFRAVNLISNEFANGIRPVLFDTKTDEYIREYDPKIQASQLLSILNNPNFNDTPSLFKRTLANCLLATGDSYIIATGIKEPLELFTENSKFITIVSGSDGYPEQYHVSKSNHKEIFSRQTIDGRIRFISQDGMREILQIRDFNPDYQAGMLHGFSRLAPIYYELEQYIQGNIHNLSQLKKGARPSGVLLYDGDLTDEQKEALRGELRKFYQGAENASEIMLLGGSQKKEFQELSINNKDMDYMGLKKIIKDSIYENLEIPASFYDNSKSTMNNKDTDKMNVYDFCVIPITRQLYEGIGQLCLPRYKDGDRYRLTFIESEIPALRERYAGILKDKIASGAFTHNEIRSEYGKESIGPEGDVLYQPATLIQIGADKFTADNLTKPITKSHASNEQIKSELRSRGASEEKIGEILKWLS